MLDSNEHSDIRLAVRKLCEGFPGEYWRKLDAERAYPTEFVQALTEAGYLAVLIPEEYGGAGLTLSAAAAVLEEIHAVGCNGAACHAQMYIMNIVLRHGNAAQKARYLPGIAAGSLRMQAFGVTEPTSGTDTSSIRTFARREGDHYIINGQKIWTSRAEHSDLMVLLARTTPRDQVTRRTDGLSVFIVDMREARGNGLTIRPIRTMMNHATTEVFFDNVRVSAENLIGEEGRLPLHPFRNECGAHLDRCRMRGRCEMAYPQGNHLRKGSPCVWPPHRRQPGDPVPNSAGICKHAGSGADGAGGNSALRIRPRLRRRGKYGEVAGRRCI